MMRLITWIKLLTIIVLIILISIFFVQNRGHVGIQFPFGGPRHFGLIYMLLVAYLLGIFTTVLASFMISAKIKKKKRLEESEDLFEEE